MGINVQKCVGCGMCVRDCIRYLFEIQDGKAVLKEGICIGCGHCVAVCPTGAIEIPLNTEDEIQEYNDRDFKIDPDQLLLFMKFRRSVRAYQPREVEPEKIQKIIEAGRYAPTAANRQKVRYILIQDNVNEFAEMSLKILNDAAEHMEEVEELRNYTYYRDKWKYLYQQNSEEDIDGMFYKAPCVLIVVDCETLAVSTGSLNCGIASDNMELMANALGLGTCYIGFFSIAAEIDNDLKEMLGLKDNERVASVLTIGYPEITYHRTVVRNRANITKISRKKEKKGCKKEKVAK